MSLNLNSDKLIVVVKADQQPIQYTGYTVTTLIGSGDTTATNISGNTWVVYSEAPSGNTWGSITGDINNQTDLINYISGQTSGLTSSWSGLTGLPSDNSDLVDYVTSEITGASTTLVGSGGTWTGLLSGTTWVVYSPDWTADILGLTMSAQTAYECCTGLTATFNDYTGDTFITLSGITVAGALLQAQTNNLQQAFTGHTGTTSIHTPYSAITFAISAATSGLTSSWSGLTGLPTDNADLMSVFSGYSLTGHVHTQYLTGFTVTCDMVTGCTDILYSKLGHTHAYSAITDTPDLSVYATQSAINTYTGTTAPNTFAALSHVHSQYLTGGTNMGTTSVLHGTPVSGQKLQLKGFDSDGKVSINDSATNITFGFGSVYLNDLIDVTVPTPAANDILKYSGSTWVNEAPLDLFANVDDLYMLRRSGSTVVGIPYSVMTGATGPQGVSGATGASGLTPTLSFTGVSVVNYTKVGTAYTIGLQAASGITPTLIFSGDTGTTVSYTKAGTTYTIGITGKTGQQGIQGAAGSGATILISSGATIATYISGDTTGNTWNVYSPDYNYVNIKSITGASYTTIAGDSNKILECASGCTGVTLHSGATTGFQLTIVSLGTQDITFSAQSGSTLRSKGSKTKLGNQYGAVTAYKNGTYWTLIGDLE